MLIPSTIVQYTALPPCRSCLLRMAAISTSRNHSHTEAVPNCIIDSILTLTVCYVKTYFFVYMCISKKKNHLPSLTCQLWEVVLFQSPKNPALIQAAASLYP